MGYTANYKFAIIAFTLLVSMAVISFDIPFLGNAFDGDVQVEDQADGVYNPNQVETSTETAVTETVETSVGFPLGYVAIYFFAISGILIGLRRRSTI